jgi:hypothetical protein
MGRSTLEPCPLADPWSIRIDTRFSRPKNHRIRRTKATELDRLLPWNWEAEQLAAAVNG